MSVLNENEHKTDGKRYARCWDQIRSVVEKINPRIKLAGPEIVLGGAAIIGLTPLLGKILLDGGLPDL